MKKIKMALLATLLTSGVAQASTPCNGFEIKIKNNLADDLVVSNIQMYGAEMLPGGIQKVDANSQQVFTVNNSADNLPMTGIMTFHTVTLPSKELVIKFDLKSMGLICEHSDNTPDGVYAIDKMRLPGKVDYTISNK